jgi:hypothetical protein
MALESFGETYYNARSSLMKNVNEGLTSTYNRFHDPRERSPEVERLRELHGAMDQAVLAAYGWLDQVDTACGFDLDWCDAEAADDASPETVERLESGRYWFATADEALAFASELSDDGARLPWRYRWRPEVRDDVLARLLLLNRDLAEAERRAGLAPPPESQDEADEVDEEGDDDDSDDM